MVKTLVFAGLKFRFRRFDQFDKMCKSRCKTWWRWSRQWKENNISMFLHKMRLRN